MSDPCQLFGASPVLPVPDVQATVEYYCTKLGFDLDALTGNPPTHGSVTRYRVGIQFTYHAEFRAESYPGWSYIFVTDADALFAEYHARAVSITFEPVSQPWGLREFEIKDLNGYRLRFGHYLSD